MLPVPGSHVGVLPDVGKLAVSAETHERLSSEAGENDMSIAVVMRIPEDVDSREAVAVEQNSTDIGDWRHDNGNGNIIYGAIASPLVEVERDYDGFFESIVRKAINAKTSTGKRCRHSRIIITSGPFRMQDIRWESHGDVLKLDFYSVARFSHPQYNDELDALL